MGAPRTRGQEGRALPTLLAPPRPTLLAPPGIAVAVACRPAFRRRLHDVVRILAQRFSLRRILLDVRTPPSLELVGKRPLLLLSLLAVLVCAPVVRAFDTPATLTDVAHVYSLGVGEVRCSSSDEWDADFASSFGMAYTNMHDDYAVLGPPVCEGALNMGNPDFPLWQQALGALVLAHEAFHLRRWRFRRNEGNRARSRTSL